MELEIKTTKKVQAKYLKVTADIRYWEDATINQVEDVNGDLVPLRKGDSWCPVINIDSGLILNWPTGVEADIHYKVCDAGIYEILDEDNNILFTKEGYVPDIMCPEGDGYGDYIIMNIDINGLISHWWPEDITGMLIENEDNF